MYRLFMFAVYRTDLIFTHLRLGTIYTGVLHITIRVASISARVGIHSFLLLANMPRIRNNTSIAWRGKKGRDEECDKSVGNRRPQEQEDRYSVELAASRVLKLHEIVGSPPVTYLMNNLSRGIWYHLST